MTRRETQADRSREADISDEVAELMEEQLTAAGEQIRLVIKITGQASIGDNWYEIH